jgi:CheY-like chemotaxis protein
MAKVLIVDDNEAFRRLNAEFLKMDGHQVLMARSGRETVDLVRQERPDIVLLDIMMPGIDGYEVCRQIKNDPDIQDTMVVMVTALPESERFKSYQAGADGYVTKPISPRDMRAMVKDLAARRQRGENAR